MTWRFLDTGQLSAAQNMALDEVLLEVKARGAAPPTLRLLRFNPPAVLIGYHQSRGQEVRRDFCRRAGIDVNRRITGGGAIFFDPTQIGWEIISDKDFFDAGVAGPRLFRRLSEPIIRTLGALGIAAGFRPRNDVEVGGRKISGTGGTEREGAFLFQGTLLVDFDVDTMLRALRIPIEKLKKREIESARERVTCLRRELGYVPAYKTLKGLIKKNFESVLGIELSERGLTEEEGRLFKERVGKFESEAWIDKVKFPPGDRPTVIVTHATEGGIIKVFLVVDLRTRTIRSALITGDLFVYPPRAIFDLEALLKDTPLTEEVVADKITAFFETRKPYIPGVKPGDFVALIGRAVEKLNLVEFGIPQPSINDVFVVNGSFAEVINQRPRLLLLPYCAKPLDCGYRYEKECPECEACSVGEAYRLGREHDLEVTTITDFEDLRRTLRRLRRRGAGSFIGCCCESFYVKHRDDFESFGVPGILVNIDNETCFDLGRAAEAYEGRFESQTALNLSLLQTVMRAL